MPPDQRSNLQYPSVSSNGSQPASSVLNGFSIDAMHDGLRGPASHSMLQPSEFPDFSFSYQDLPPDSHVMGLEDHGADLFAANTGPSSISSLSDQKDSSIGTGPSFPGIGHPQTQQRHEGSENGSPESNHLGNAALEDQMSDEFGLSTAMAADGVEGGGKVKENKSDVIPAWSELKTKAGKERKRLPLACLVCRRKKIRCSGEKPSCKHCLRSRIVCLYKATPRKAAPRTDYMAMLDKRLKRMEDRIIKILPKSEQDPAAANVVRAQVKPQLPGSLSTGKQNAKKRAADEAFGSALESWAKQPPPKPKQQQDSNTSPSAQAQEQEDSELLEEGREALPPMDIQQHLGEVFFENVYGQAYHLLHKPSYVRKLNRAGTLPPVLILSVCAVSARFSTHPIFAKQDNFLRGEEWAKPARDIVTKRYEWPNITILTCLLILGLHEFGTCHGGRSWSLGGQAIRMAFALQLHKDLDRDPKAAPSSQLSFIDREIRRRTMWACFLMDRFNSSGTDRPIFIREETIKIQLPIREKLFQLDMPGVTEDLEGNVPHTASAPDGEPANAIENMGVAAYMIRSIALWGRIINFLNQGGKEADSRSMWDADSQYSSLLKQVQALAAGLPDELKYTPDNVRLHDTEGVANQFIFLHISIQQNMLFMNRFAVSSPAGIPQVDVPESFITQAGARAFAAAKSISGLLRDAERYMICAPFVGYCAFLSSTVHIFGIFSGNAAVEQSSKRNLEVNCRFLEKMKRHWGMFHYMLENLREQYRVCADASHNGLQAAQNARTSPIFQYGDWFDHYPHGVSQSDFLDPAVAVKKKDSGGDAVLEQRPDAYTVEEFLTQLSPPQSNEGREATGNSAPQPPTQAKRKSIASGANKKGGTHSRGAASQHLEPLNTDVSTTLPEQIQQRLQAQRQQHAARMSVQTSGQTSLHPNMQNPHNSQQNPGAVSANPAYSTLSPISPVTHGLNQQFTPAHQAVHAGHPGQGHPNYSNPDLIALGLANNVTASMLPRLDRQLVFNAYGGLDTAAMGGPPENMIDWDALTGGVAGNGVVARDGGPEVLHQPGFATDNSSAWYMPFNLEPPELGQDVGGGAGMGGVDTFAGMFSPGSMATPTPGGGLGMRRGSHR
ncbi:fungal-specific transcription factor domain-containing protein [Xylariales sp. PMI_506]|nr:fungal-specific transcription factor domain-containing protein [Xylariales sp. PMI_506]